MSKLHKYLAIGASAKITETAGISLGVLYGGKTAMAARPAGTRARAVARFAGVAAPAPTAEGVAPPPALPGAALPIM